MTERKTSTDDAVQNLLFDSGEPTEQADARRLSFWQRNLQPAIERADQNASDRWKSEADRCLRLLALRNATITADDLVEMLEDREVTTHNLSALGPVFLRARNAGQIRNSNQMVQSRIPRRHRKITVWESLIYVPKVR